MRYIRPYCPPAALIALAACGGSQAAPTTYQQSLVAQEQTEKTLCVTSNTSREVMEKCVAEVKAKYDAKFKDSGL